MFLNSFCQYPSNGPGPISELVWSWIRICFKTSLHTKCPQKETFESLASHECKVMLEAICNFQNKTGTFTFLNMDPVIELSFQVSLWKSSHSYNLKAISQAKRIFNL